MRRAGSQIRTLALLGFAIGALAGCAAAITADVKDRVAESDERNNAAAGVCRNQHSTDTHRTQVSCRHFLRG